MPACYYKLRYPLAHVDCDVRVTENNTLEGMQNINKDLLKDTKKFAAPRHIHKLLEHASRPFVVHPGHLG